MTYFLHYNEFIHENNFLFTLLWRHSFIISLLNKISSLGRCPQRPLYSFPVLFQSSFSLPVASTAHAKEIQQYECFYITNRLPLSITVHMRVLPRSEFTFKRAVFLRFSICFLHLRFYDILLYSNIHSNNFHYIYFFGFLHYDIHFFTPYFFPKIYL